MAQTQELFFLAFFVPWSTVVSCHAGDGVRWTCPAGGCKSSVAHDPRPRNCQGRLFRTGSPRSKFVSEVHVRTGTATVRNTGSSRPCSPIAGSQSTSRSRGRGRRCGNAEVGGGYRGVGRVESTDALQAAKSRSRVPPVAERIEACKTFLERAKRRVVRAEEIMKRAVEQKDVYVAEVEDAERRLLQLHGEAVAAPHAIVSEVGELKMQIDELVQERDQLHQTVCKGVPKQLQGEWFSDGATDLAKVPPAIRSPGFGRVVGKQELRVAQCSGVRRCCVDCQTRHFVERRGIDVGSYERRTHGLQRQVVQDERIDRRRRVEAQVCGECAIQSVEPGVRNARCGLRGVRVGEASHPGATRLRDEDEVWGNLELALTMVDSDDEPLTGVAHSRRDGQVREVC